MQTQLHCNCINAIFVENCASLIHIGACTSKGPNKAAKLVVGVCVLLVGRKIGGKKEWMCKLIARFVSGRETHSANKSFRNCPLRSRLSMQLQFVYNTVISCTYTKCGKYIVCSREIYLV